nr:hypothetical protein Iba_chr12eCG11370 [Ipomoea batatas]
MEDLRLRLSTAGIDVIETPELQRAAADHWLRRRRRLAVESGNMNNTHSLTRKLLRSELNIPCRARLCLSNSNTSRPGKQNCCRCWRFGISAGKCCSHRNPRWGNSLWLSFLGFSELPCHFSSASSSPSQDAHHLFVKIPQSDTFTSNKMGMAVNIRQLITSTAIASFKGGTAILGGAVGGGTLEVGRIGPKVGGARPEVI